MQSYWTNTISFTPFIFTQYKSRITMLDFPSSDFPHLYRWVQRKQILWDLTLVNSKQTQWAIVSWCWSSQCSIRVSDSSKNCSALQIGRFENIQSTLLCNRLFRASCILLIHSLLLSWFPLCKCVWEYFKSMMQRLQRTKILCKQNAK